MTAADAPYAFSVANADGETTRIVFAASLALAVADEEEGMEVARAPQHDAHAPGPVPADALLADGWRLHCSHLDCLRTLDLGDEDMWAPPCGDPSIVREEAERVAAERRRDAWLEANPEPPEAPEGSPWGDVRRQRNLREDWRRTRPDDCRGPRPPRIDRDALRFDGEHVYCTIACERAQARSVLLVDAAHADAEAEAERRWPGAGPYGSGRWPQLNPSVAFTPPGHVHPARWRPGDEEPWVADVDSEAWSAYLDTMDAKEETT